MSEDLREKVLKHEFTIGEMAKSIQVLAETTKDSNIKLGEIAKSMSKQELILEKLTNLEGNTKDSINRIHKRIDGFEQQMKDIICVGEKDGCTALKNDFSPNCLL